jgi:hypothetical protein
MKGLRYVQQSLTIQNDIMESQFKMEVIAKVNNGQHVYIVYETTDYYLVSLNADGTKRFKADKPRPVRSGRVVKESLEVAEQRA